MNMRKLFWLDLIPCLFFILLRILFCFIFNIFNIVFIIPEIFIFIAILIVYLLKSKKQDFNTYSTYIYMALFCVLIFILLFQSLYLSQNGYCYYYSSLITIPFIGLFYEIKNYVFFRKNHFDYQQRKVGITNNVLALLITFIIAMIIFFSISLYTDRDITYYFYAWLFLIFSNLTLYILDYGLKKSFICRIEEEHNGIIRYVSLDIKNIFLFLFIIYFLVNVISLYSNINNYFCDRSIFNKENVQLYLIICIYEAIFMASFLIYSFIEFYKKKNLDKNMIITILCFISFVLVLSLTELITNCIKNYYPFSVERIKLIETFLNDLSVIKNAIKIFTILLIFLYFNYRKLGILKYISLIVILSIIVIIYPTFDNLIFGNNLLSNIRSGIISLICTSFIFFIIIRIFYKLSLPVVEIKEVYSHHEKKG